MLKCIVVDDEQMNRLLLEEFIAQVPFLTLVGSCKNAFDAMKLLDNQEVDLMFLDVQMPGMLGIDLLKALKKKPMTILVTAYSEYALDGYDLEVVDYLMKPLSIERFIKAAYRANEIYEKNNEIPESIFVNVDYGLVKIKLSELMYVEGLKDYVKIYTENSNRAILTKSTMKGIEEKLPARMFMRVHRSYIINLKKIDKIKGLKLFIGQNEISISETSIDDLLGRLQG